MPKSLATALTRERLRKLAGDRAYERGEAYARNGHVGEIAEDGGHITASVNGEMRYRTNLWVSSSKITYSCTCPVGEDGVCCKHCVALGLRWLDERVSATRASNNTSARATSKKATSAKRRAEPRPLTMKDVRVYLAELPAEALVELVVQQAMHDDGLRQRLLLDTANARGSDARIHTYRRALTATIGSAEFVDYREAFDYFARIHEVVSSLEQLNRDEPAAVIELVEHALSLMEQAIGHVDDSGGHTGEVLGRLHTLHLAACVKVRPDPEALAQRLFDWEMRSEWEIFSGALARYAKVLGATGIARYRALAEAAWQKVPAIGAGQQNRAFTSTRFRITAIMESLARLSGDVDAVVAVKSHDLSSAWSYLTVAKLYDEARQRDRAIEWAERGIAAFPTKTDGRLREFLAAQYKRTKRVPEAIELLWQNFADYPSVPGYTALKAIAMTAKAWPAWRERAIGEVRGRIPARTTAATRAKNPYAPDGSLLVEILLWEGEADAAWTEAQASSCSAQLWLQLAKRREGSHPEDAVAVYQVAVERALSRTNNDAYREAVSTIRVIARLMTSTTIDGGFVAYLASVQARHKAKRNFMRMLDAAKFAK